MSRLEHSELVLGPFEILTNLELDPLVKSRNFTYEFPRKCISVNPRNCTDEFPRKCISVNPRKCFFSVKSKINFNACIQQYFTLALNR